MPNIISEDDIEIAIVQRLQHHDGYDSLNCYGSMFSILFRESEPQNFAEVMDSDTDRFTRVFHALLEQRVYLPPSPFESSFLL